MFGALVILVVTTGCGNRSGAPAMGDQSSVDATTSTEDSSSVDSASSEAGTGSNDPASDSGSEEARPFDEAGAGTAPDVSCAAFTMSGDPTGAAGAKWTYVSTDAGVPYNLEGILFAPSGAGPFPAVVVSHGAGGLPTNYSAAIARTMVSWRMVAIGTRYSHAADPDMHNAALLPAGANGASDANVQRAHKTRDLLSCVASVDMKRVAAHGHSMGAFVTGQLVGTFSPDFRAASHTAGGTSVGPNATRAAAAAMIRTPYQIHHGEADMVVAIMQDESLDAILTANTVVHEFHRYPGYSHEQMSLDATMLDRVRGWYTSHGVLP
jgi:dienelactone hydrolase